MIMETATDPESIGIAWTIVLVGLYFLPAITAKTRGHRYTGAVTALNVLLGWTLIGWAVALIWALMTPTPGARS